MDKILDVIFVGIMIVFINLLIMSIFFVIGSGIGYVVGLLIPTIFGIKTWLLFGIILAFLSIFT